MSFLLLFTNREKRPFSQATRFIIRAEKEVCKITREFDLSHDQAKKWKSTRPTLLLDPEHYHVRWLGARSKRRDVQEALMMGQKDRFE
jgi:hypothetical protein